MTRLLIVGPPGAGKGTQAALLADALGVIAISTGDIFREHVRTKTDLGQQVATIMAAGGYISDEITNAMVARRLSEPDVTDGFILDGYPRTAAQLQELDGFLRHAGCELDAVVQLEVNADALIRRLIKRGAQVGRSDDTAEAIRRRLEIYDAQTAPLLSHYRARGLLITVSGLAPVESVNRGIQNLLTPRLQHQDAPVIGSTDLSQSLR